MLLAEIVAIFVYHTSSQRSDYGIWALYLP